MLTTSEPDAFVAPIRITLAGQDADLATVSQVLEDEAETRHMPLRLSRIGALPRNHEDLAARLLDISLSAGLDALHLADPLRGAFSRLLRARLDGSDSGGRRTPLPPPAEGLVVDTVLMGGGAILGYCSAATRAHQDMLGRFLRRRPRDHVLVIGAGTEGTCVAMALARLGVKRLSFHDRDMARAATLADLVARTTGTRTSLLAGTGALFHDFSRPGIVQGWLDGLVNATPVGSAARPGQVVPASGIEAPLWVLDCAAQRGETPLTRMARARGCAVLTAQEIAQRRGKRLFDCSLSVGATGQRPHPGPARARCLGC